MSEEQKPADKPVRTRRIVPAADTKAPPAPALVEAAKAEPANPAPAPADDAAPAKPAAASPRPVPTAIVASDADASASGKRWDVRADRSERPARPRIARASRSTGASAARPGPDAQATGTASGETGATRPPREPRGGLDYPRRPRRTFEGAAPAEGGEPRFYGERGPRRPGTSGGRAMPGRFGVDRANASFVDQWLSTPQRKPEERKPEERRGERRPEGADDAQGGERRFERRPRRDERSAEASSPRPIAKPAPAPAPAPKLPTLHETILVGLPKVAVESKTDKSANKPKTAKEALLAKAATKPVEAPKATAKPKLELDPAWIAADADGAVAALAAAGDAADALVDAWLAGKNHAAIAATAASEAVQGTGRKAARRAAGVLKSRGIALPQLAPKAAALATVEEEIVEATYSAADGRGAYSITITKRRGGDRAHIAEIVAREGVGVTSAQAGWMSRSQIREAHQRIADATGLAPAKIPVAWARAQIAAALADNAKSGQLVPLSIERCRELIEPAPTTAPAHPTADLEADLADANATLSIDLHAEPELRGWAADNAALDQLVRDVTAKLGPAEANDPKRVDEVLQAEVRTATDAYFDEARRASLAARLRNAAISARGRSEAAAKTLLGAARAVERASQPSEQEFLRGFFQKGIAMRAAQSNAQARGR